jgi:hypothetical protein
MKPFNSNKYKFEITIPKGIKEEWFSNKIRFIGSKNEISSLSREFKKLKDLRDGEKVKLGKITLKVSNYITEDRNEKNYVELPNHAWGIMSSKFYDVWEGFEENPFDFNDCGYTNKNPFDIGIEIQDLPLSDEVVLELPHIKLFKSEWKELYILIEGTKLFNFIDESIAENCDIVNLKLEQSEIKNKSRYRVYFDPKVEKKLTSELKKLSIDEIEKLWKIGNK